MIKEKINIIVAVTAKGKKCRRGRHDRRQFYLNKSLFSETKACGEKKRALSTPITFLVTDEPTAMDAIKVVIFYS